MLIKKLSDNSKEYLDTYYEIVDDMKNKMLAVQHCNSISQTYIQQTIAHGEGGVLLSENILNYTTDIEIEAIAKAYIELQNSSLEFLRSILDECCSATNSERDVNLYQRKAVDIINSMILNLNSIQSTNNLNLLYLQAILYHQDGAILLAKNVLNYEICPKLRQHINEQIIKLTAQQTLIRKLLNANRK